MAATAGMALMAMAGPSHADMAAAERWVDEEFQPSTLSREEQLAEMEWFIQAAEPYRRHGDQRAVGDDPDAHLRIRGAHPGLRGDHRDQGQPSASGRRRGRAGRADPDADQPESLRRLHQQLRPDRHPFPSAERGQPHRLDGRRGQGRHQSEPRHRRLHRQVVHHRSGRQALAAAGPAVRQPLLVPQGLVRPRGPAGPVQGEVRLRSGRAGRLVGL